MATVVDNVVYLPIGCSCINQFQLNFCFENKHYDSQLFDWSITTPDATIAILRDKKTFINGLDDIEFLSANIPFSRLMPGYFIWHLEKMLPKEQLPIASRADLSPFINNLIEKHKYQINKMFGMGPFEVRCIWSNIQPNLKRSTEPRGVNFSDFFLSVSRYKQIKALVKERWVNSSAWFVVRAADVDEVLIGQPDVVVLNLERSSAYNGVKNTSDFKGEKHTFAPLWERIHKIKP